MEKRVLCRQSDEISFPYGTCFYKVLQKLKDFEQVVPAESILDYTDLWDGDKNFVFTWESLETDEELQQRISQESSREEKLLEKERTEYERLKAKFEKTNE